MTTELLKTPAASRRFLPALCASALFLAVFALYLYAHEPDGGWGDGPDFVVCSYFLGVPHPTGYPLFAILGKAATFVPVGTIAFRVGLLSTCAGALAAAFLFFALLRLIRHAAVAMAAAFAFCTSSLVLTQSITVEAYALNLLFMTILALLFMQNSDIRYAFAFFLVAAMGLGNHGTLVFAALILGLLPLDQSLKSRASGASLFVITFIILAGLFAYASLPLSAARGFQFIWNDPLNIKNFLQLLSGADFWSGMGHFDIIMKYLAKYSGYFLSQFMTVCVIFLLVFFSAITGEKRSAAPCLFLLVCAFAGTTFAILYPTAEKSSFLLMPAAAAIVGVSAFPGRREPGAVSLLSARPVLGAGACMLLLWWAFLMLSHYGIHQVRMRDESSGAYARAMFKDSERDALLLIDHVADDTVYAPVYIQSVESVRPDVFLLHRMLLAFPWYMDAMRARASAAHAAVEIPRIDLDAEADRIYEVTEEEKRLRDSGEYANTISVDAQTSYLLNSNMRRIPVYFTMPELFLRSSFSRIYDIAPSGILFQAGRESAGAPAPEMPLFKNAVYRELMYLVFMHRGGSFLIASQENDIYDSEENMGKALDAFETSIEFKKDCQLYSIMEALYRSRGVTKRADKYKSLMASDFCMGDNSRQ